MYEIIKRDGKVVDFDIAKIANAVRSVPRDYINEAGNNVNEKCLAYIRPLIQGEVSPKYVDGLPVHFVIE